MAKSISNKVLWGIGSTSKIISNYMIPSRKSQHSSQRKPAEINSNGSTNEKNHPLQAEFLSDRKINGKANTMEMNDIEMDSRTDKSDGQAIQFYKMGKQMISPRLTSFYPRVSKFFMTND